MDAHPGKSGTALLSTGEWGFRARAGLANQAEKTIDVQYYIWEVDTAAPAHQLDGEQVRYYSDPEVGLWQRFSTWFIGLLPIEKHL